MSLEYIEAGDSSSPDKIILFHGYGASMEDLYSLNEVIETDKNYHWIFPNGFLEVPIGPFMTGRAWFNIDIASFDRALRMGEFSKRSPSGMTEARKKVEDFLRQLNIDYSKTYIGGFSQGAMLTLDLVLETDIRPKGVALLSSTLVKEGEWVPKMQNKKGLKYYQSHGHQDTILPYELAEKLNEHLEKSEWNGYMRSFSGGHEIPMKVIQDLSQFFT